MTRNNPQNSVPEWRLSGAPVPYDAALAEMEALAAAIHEGQAPETVWLLEHPPVYTAGTSARDSDLLDPRFPVFAAGRGGQYTYHGPGQRVGYVMLDLSRRGRDLRGFVHNVEEWVIRSLGDFGVSAGRVEGRVGIWTGNAKIAAIGVRVRKWVTFHGVAINVAPDLSHFSGIVPCGISDAGVTSLKALGIKAGFPELDAALRRHWDGVFGPQGPAGA
jgi:lipoyl(octanoyl) transferase